MSKRCYWNKEEKKYSYREVPCEKFYTKEDLLYAMDCLKDLDRNETYYIHPEGMYDEWGNEIFKPKYIGEYPSVLKEFKNLEKIV